MLVLDTLDNLPRRGLGHLVLTLGAFDGIHLGHQTILSQLKAAAVISGSRSAVFTFQEHPQNVLNPENPRTILTSYRHKLLLLKRLGIEVCITPHFNKRFARLSPQSFVEGILIKKLRVKKVIIGSDARFGHKQAGDVELMSHFAHQYGFGFEMIPSVSKGTHVVKSTLVRQFVKEGQLVAARRLLGAPYSILARVVKGSGRGRKLGYPTANLDAELEVLPPQGVYAIRIREVEVVSRKKGPSALDVNENTGKWHPGVLNLGIRPTFDSGDARIVPEAHILKFHKDLYGKTVEVQFLKKIRNERRFSNANELLLQIAKDIEKVDNWLNSNRLC